MRKKPSAASEITQPHKSERWSPVRWLTTHKTVFHRRSALIWTLIAALWLDWLVTAVALLFSDGIQELNPLGLALYDNIGVLGLAGLKAWASLLLFLIAGWIRPLRAVKVLQLTLGFYALIVVWNGIQVAFFL